MDFSLDRLELGHHASRQGDHQSDVEGSDASVLEGIGQCMEQVLPSWFPPGQAGASLSAFP